MRRRLLSGLSALTFVASLAAAEPLRNADLIKLLDAQIPEEAILGSIAQNGGIFDTTPDALVELKHHGATAAVLRAVAAPVPSTSTPSPDPTRNGPALRPQFVLMLDEGRELSLPTQFVRTKSEPARSGSDA